MGDIFQAKVNKILGDIKDFKMYINDILVLRKECFTNHIEQLRIIFGRFHAAELKFNYTKYSIGLKEIPYLSYVITREGINHDPKKVQVVMDPGQPTTTKEAQALTYMFQYFMDMFPRRSHVVATLTEAARNPKGRK